MYEENIYTYNIKQCNSVFQKQFDSQLFAGLIFTLLSVKPKWPKDQYFLKLQYLNIQIIKIEKLKFKQILPM